MHDKQYIFHLLVLQTEASCSKNSNVYLQYTNSTMVVSGNKKIYSNE